MVKDTRFVYGALCSWFGRIDEVGHLPGGLPCCPHCKSPLFEMHSEEDWWRRVDKYCADADVPDYRAMLEWARDKHFITYQEMKEAYDRRGAVGVHDDGG